jgi:hypothetical protein
MDWESLISFIVAILVLTGLPLALLKRKKAGARKKEELLLHLKGMGVEASLTEQGDGREKIGPSRASGQRSEGIIQLEGGNIDSINIISTTSQHGVNYFLDYLVKSPNITKSRTLKKTSLTRKRSSLLWGSVVDVHWKGDKSLAQSLNFDYQLKDRLVKPDAGLPGIRLFPEPGYGYARIRTPYALPTPETVETLDIIARHARSW